MKLLMLIDSFGSGGAQRQMVLLLRGLVERGHDVAVANYYPHLNHFRAELKKVCQVIDLTKTSRWSLAPVLSLRKILYQSQPDILLSFLDTPNIYSILAGARIMTTKVVVSERFTFFGDTPNFAEKCRYLMYHAADAMTANSEHQKNNIIKYFPSLTRKICRIYNGVDLERFSPGLISRNIASRPLRLLAIASIATKKNPTTLIKALVLAKKQGLNVKICWVGTSSVSGEGECVFEQCKKLINERNLDAEWEWLGERSDIPELMQSHDALVHPSFKEGFPNVVCEALASGLPVLASNVGDHSYLVEQGVSGFLFNPELEDSILKAISTFYHLDDKDIQKMRGASRSFAESHLDSKKLAENYENLFLSLINQ